jgi:hypothetical protein
MYKLSKSNTVSDTVNIDQSYNENIYNTHTPLQVSSVLARSKTVNFQSSSHRLRTINTPANEVKPK